MMPGGLIQAKGLEMEQDEVEFLPGKRKEAIEKAIALVRQKGRPAKLIICRDILGKHTAGEDCFCGPRIIEIYPEEDE